MPTWKKLHTEWKAPRCFKAKWF